MDYLWIALILVAVWVAVRLFASAAVRRRSEQLVESSVESPSFSGIGDDERNWLATWLSRAGFREPTAALLFLGATVGLTAIGLLCVLLMNRLGVVRSMVDTLTEIPGGVGDALALVATIGPYLILTMFVVAPTLVVRAARRSRVEAIEQDLAPNLELLATLAEAGLGFDSAIARIQESESETRPLNQEFQIYQRDTLGGIPRLEALRKMGTRIDLISVSIFVSALIQAERVGASLSETLRTQADDLRDRRKLRALLLAQALPVKLVFPLMACFLPGIFYSTLGPVLSQLVDVVDGIIGRH